MRLLSTWLDYLNNGRIRADLGSGVVLDTDAILSAARPMDTGWRNVTAACPWINPTAGTVGNTVLLRRSGNAVHLTLNNVSPSTSGNLPELYAVPYGFRSPIRLDFWITATGTTNKSAYLFANGGMGMWAASTSDSYRQTVSWFTADPWPATLPGTPA